MKLNQDKYTLLVPVHKYENVFAKIRKVKYLTAISESSLVL